MSLITLSGTPVVSGELGLPLIGAWHLEAVMATADAPVVGESVTLSLGGVPFVGAVVYAASDSGNRVTVRVVGGRGGLGDTVPAKGYYQTTRKVVLADALGTGGESLSLTSDGLDVYLGHWTRLESTVADVVRHVAEHAGLNWRVLADGSVWLGSETWLPLEVTHTLDSEEPTREAFTVALEAASVLPGVTFRGHQVSGVVYTFDSRKIRARVSYGAARGEIQSILGELVRRETRKADYHGIYLATANAQNADLTLELTPADTKVPSMSNVPIKPGVPGCTVPKLTPGASVVLGHENGDPSKPRVIGFDTSTALEIALNATARVQVGESASEVLLGTGSQFVALANLVDAEFGKVLGALNTAIAPSGGGPVTYGSPYAKASTAGAQVKAT